MIAAMELPTRRILTLEAARRMMAAAHAEATRNGWKVVIAVVDEGGHAIALERIDGTQWSSVETALGKARAAVGFRRPTRMLEDMINNGRHAFLSAPGPFALLQGGMPVEVEGQVVGGIGVSGVKASDDERVAQAGILAISTQNT